MPLCTDYSSTLDCFAYIFLSAPNFLGNKTFTLDSVFADIDGGVSAVARRTNNAEALKLMDECRSELRAALQLYKEKKDVEAQKRTRNAQQIFRQAGKLRKSTAPKAERVDEDYQE